MHPILLKFGPITIYSFGLFLAVSVLIASFIVWKRARQNALSDEKVIDIFIFSISSFIISGRLIYVFQNLAFFQNDFGRVFLLLKYPGLSFGGGVAVCVMLIVFMSRLNGISPWMALDIFTFAFSIAAIFGFTGCYLDGCMPGFSSQVPLVLVIVSGVISILLWAISRGVKNSIGLSKLTKRPGLIFLSYLQFISISFLILSYGNKRSDVWVFLGIFGISFVVFLVRYRELVSMIKFPSSVLGQIKKYLEDRRREIEKRLSELKKEDPFEDKTRLLDRASDDSEAQSKAGHERVAALTRQMSMALVETRKALTKIKVGKYGICESCGKMIDTDRLAAMPTATLCLSCEKKKERR